MSWFPPDVRAPVKASLHAMAREPLFVVGPAWARWGYAIPAVILLAVLVLRTVKHGWLDGLTNSGVLIVWIYVWACAERARWAVGPIGFVLLSIACALSVAALFL